MPSIKSLLPASVELEDWWPLLAFWIHREANRAHLKTSMKQDGSRQSGVALPWHKVDLAPRRVAGGPSACCRKWCWWGKPSRWSRHASSFC